MENLKEFFIKDKIDLKSNKKSSLLDDTTVSDVLKSIVDNMDNGCMIIDFNYRYRYVNKVISEHSQNGKSHFIGHTMMERNPDIVKSEFFANVQDCMKSRVSKKFDYNFTTEDGLKGLYKVDIDPIKEGLIILMMDKTESKEVEKKLVAKNTELESINKEQEQNSDAMIKVLADLEKAKVDIENEKATDAAMLASIGEGVFAVDKDNRFLLINPKAEELIGLKASTLIGNSLSPGDIPLEYENGDFILPKDRPTIKAIATGKSSFSDKYVIVRKDKSRKPISLTVTPIKQNGKIVGAIDVFRDITLEKQIDRAKTEFITIASHQLRTPLGIVKWCLEIIEADPYIKKSPQVVKGYIDEIGKSNERLLELVRNLLSVSRIDEGRVRDEPQQTDIWKVVKDTVDDMEIVAAKKKVKLSLESGKIVETLYIDPTRFKEVFENLITNSIKYNKVGGKVDIKLSTHLNKVNIEIKDNGIGISKEDIGHIFTKFFRSDKAVLSNPEGSGLGLYIAKSYLEEWGGSISVESIEGKGSTFTIIIPLKPNKK